MTQEHTADPADEMYGWHWCNEERRLGYDDGRAIVAGETLSVDGTPVLCQHGLHASERPLDALEYAPGPVICRVRLSGVIVRGDDKAVATHRTTLWMADATLLLHEFACRVAETALLAERAAGRDPHGACWEAIRVKRAWIRGEATDEELAAAWAAARDAAWAAARDEQNSLLDAMLRDLMRADGYDLDAEGAPS